jgi:hypothetical protein
MCVRISEGVCVVAEEAGELNFLIFFLCLLDCDFLLLIESVHEARREARAGRFPLVLLMRVALDVAVGADCHLPVAWIRLVYAALSY